MPTKKNIFSSRADVTRENIRLAMSRIEKKRPKVISIERRISIAAVAEEAGISRATIHNNHPDLADRIRAVSGRKSRDQRDRKAAELAKEKLKSRELRRELSEYRRKVRQLASINATLTVRVHELESINSAKNVTPIRSTK